MPPSLTVSVIIPVLNEAAHLPILLQSLQAARREGHELIVVDGGSEDNTLDQVQGLADKIIRSERGRATQMNAGAEQATGQILWFLHADSQIPPFALTHIIECMTHCTSQWGRFNVRIQHPKLIFKIISFLMNQRSRLTGICTGDQGIFIHRSLFAQVEGFPALVLMEDIALSRRLLNIAGRACIITTDAPLLTSPRRWQQYGMTKTIVLMWFLRLAYFLGQDPARLKRWYP